MEAAKDTILGNKTITAATRDVLERIARLACRATGADEVVVLVRPDEDDRPPVRVVSHCDGVPEPDTEDPQPVIERALATGAPVAGEGGGRLRAAAPLAWAGEVRGALAAVGAGPGRRFERTELDSLRELAELASTALHESEQRARLEEIVDAGVAALVRAVDMRDDYTGRHSSLVGDLARRVGERLGMSGMDLWMLELAAQLHDVGKIGIPDAILNKSGPLDSAEWGIMRAHPAMGADMVAKVPGLATVAPLVRAHHERWDGRGYPDGLAADEIPLASRVVAACDTFQAMTADRPYRRALDVDEAVAELLACAGSQFDPAVVSALCEEHMLDHRRSAA